MAELTSLKNIGKEMEVSNFIMKLLAKPYLKNQQKRYMRDLEKEINNDRRK